MINIVIRKLNILTGLLLSILCLTVVILFFPVNIEHHYTCLFHKQFNAQHIINTKNALLADSSVRPKAGNSSDNQSIAHSQLLHFYIKEYALVWWASLIIFVLIINYLRKTIIKLNAIAKE